MKPTSISIIEILKKAGHEAYWAGGCVRDMLLGHEPKDFDIATSAKPDEIEKLLEYTKPVGKEFGVILVIKNKHHFEVATFRSDSGYSDGRRPDAVLFTDDKEDALRRDFTINGMFYDPIEDKIIDHIEGQKDLDAKLIRFIGDPEERILEDHLRIIRAIRFKNHFDFQYHPDTYKALKQHAALADNVSAERLRDELNKMLDGENSWQAFEDMSELGILEKILPELEATRGVPQPKEYHEEGDVWDHSIRSLQMCDPKAFRNVKWASLLHDIGKAETFSLKGRIRFDRHVNVSKDLVHKVGKRLRFANKDLKEIEWYVVHHMMMMPLIDMAEGAVRKWFLHPKFLGLMEVFEADAKGIVPTDLSLYKQILKRYRKFVKKIRVKPKPLVTGEDVMEILEMEPGKEVGQIVEDLYELQLERRFKTKEKGIEYLKANYKK